MDEYGCMRVTQEDALEVRQSLAQGGSVVFALSGDQIGAMIICVTTQFEKLGVMPFGGNPIGRAYVGVYGRGCSHLAMGETHPSYISEKLNLTQEDAKTFAEFWALLWEQSG